MDQTVVTVKVKFLHMHISHLCTGKCRMLIFPLWMEFDLSDLLQLQKPRECN